MNMGFKLITIFLYGCVILVVQSSIPGMVDHGDGSGTITMKAGYLGDEATHSPHMPQNLRCDACRIIAHMLFSRFDKQHNKMKSLIEKTGRLTESDVIDVIESVCEDKFQSVGVKEIDGKNRLSGPGLETKDVPGVMQGGGMWPHRLRTMCSGYAGDIGEAEIYSGYLEHKENLANFLCKGTGIRGDCVSKEKEKSNDTDGSEKKEEL